MENSTELIKRVVKSAVDQISEVDALKETTIDLINLVTGSPFLNIQKYLNELTYPEKKNKDDISDYLQFLKFSYTVTERKSIYRLSDILGPGYDYYFNTLVLNSSDFATEYDKPYDFTSSLNFFKSVIKRNEFENEAWKDVGIFTFQPTVTPDNIKQLQTAITSFENGEYALFDIPEPFAAVVYDTYHNLNQSGGNASTQDIPVVEKEPYLPEEILTILQNILLNDKYQNKQKGNTNAGVAFENLTKLPFIGVFNVADTYVVKKVETNPMYERFGKNKYTQKVDEFLNGLQADKYIFTFQHSTKEDVRFSIVTLHPDTNFEIRQTLKQLVLTAVYEYCIQDDPQQTPSFIMCYALIFLYYSGQYTSVVHEQLLDWNVKLDYATAATFLAAVNINIRYYNLEAEDVEYDHELKRIFCMCDTAMVTKAPSDSKVSPIQELFNYIGNNYNIERKAGTLEKFKSTIISTSQYKKYLPMIVLSLCGFELRKAPLKDEDRVDSTSTSPLPKQIGMSFNQFKEVYSQNQDVINGLFYIVVLRNGICATTQMNTGERKLVETLLALSNEEVDYTPVSEYVIGQFPHENIAAKFRYVDGIFDTIIECNLVFNNNKFQTDIGVWKAVNGEKTQNLEATEAVQDFDLMRVYDMFSGRTENSKLLLDTLKKERNRNVVISYLKTITDNAEYTTEEVRNFITNNNLSDNIVYKGGMKINASMTFEEGTDADNCRYLLVPVMFNNVLLPRLLLSVRNKLKGDEVSSVVSKQINNFELQLAIKLATQNTTLRSKLACAVTSLLALTGYDVEKSVQHGRNVFIVKGYSEEGLKKKLLGWKFPLSDEIIKGIIELIAKIAISFLIGENNQKAYQVAGSTEQVSDIMFVCEFKPLAFNDVLDPVFKQCIQKHAPTQTALSEYIKHCERYNDGKIEFFKGETERISSCVEELIRNNVFNETTVNMIEAPYHKKMNNMVEEMGIKAGLNDDSPCSFLIQIKEILNKLKTMKVDNEYIAKDISAELLEHWPFLKNQAFSTSISPSGLDPSMSAILDYLKHYCNDRISDDARSKLFDEIKNFLILQRNCQNFLMLLQMTNKFVQIIRRSSKIPQDEIQKNYIEILKIVFEYVEPKLKTMLSKQQDLAERCLKRYRDNLGLKDDNQDFNLESEFTSFVQKILGVDLATLVPPPKPCVPISKAEENNEDLKLSNYLLYF